MAIIVLHYIKALRAQKKKDMITPEEAKILALISCRTTRDKGFVLLMQRYSEPLYWHIRRLVVVHEDAEDVLQESFINIDRYIETFKGESSLKTWLYKIATNEAIRHYKKKKLETQSYDDDSKLIHIFEQESDVDFTTAEALLQRSLLGLPEKQRIVFNLRHYEDMSYDQISKITNSSVATLKTNFHYASTKLKELLLKGISKF